MIIILQKDWIGSKQSTFRTLGASSHSNTEREKNDYYATDPKATEYLCDLVKFNKTILEPAVGGGHIAEVLKNRGYNVICSDIIDRGYPNTHIKDFLAFNDVMTFDVDIITNPPYKFALPFIKKALKIIPNGNKVAMFLKLQFLEGKERKAFYKENPPKYIYVSSSRLTCAINGDFEKTGSSAVCYAWFIWEKGFKGEPVVRWFN